jgi:hypothetical protein
LVYELNRHGVAGLSQVAGDSAQYPTGGEPGKELLQDESMTPSRKNARVRRADGSIAVAYQIVQ